MASLLFLLFWSLCFSLLHAKSPYLSPSIFLPNYGQMLSQFKIYPYPNPNTKNTTLSLSTNHSSSFSLFHQTLLTSHFITSDPGEAHLFYLPFPATPQFSGNRRTLARYIRDVRSTFPFWNQTLGADHFYASPHLIAVDSDRNLVELKKNSVQVAGFLPGYSTVNGMFLPHKDIMLPPIPHRKKIGEGGGRGHLVGEKIGEGKKGTGQFLGCYVGDDTRQVRSVLEYLREDSRFMIESQPLDLGSCGFCLFLYGGDLTAMRGALWAGCVPVVISSRPILEMPFSDVLDWNGIAMFVGAKAVKGLAGRLEEAFGQGRHEEMRGAGQRAAVHLIWNSPPRPYDAFYTVMYQLWLRRHTIRYARRQNL
ncbi:hypothetical protein AMTRI_Chr08g203120 [Amborella trichopoda]